MKITRNQLIRIIKEEAARLSEQGPGKCFTTIQLAMHPEEFAGMEPDRDDPCWEEWESNYTAMGGVVDDGIQAARPDDRKDKEPKKESAFSSDLDLAKIVSEEVRRVLIKRKR